MLAGIFRPAARAAAHYYRPLPQRCLGIQRPYHWQAAALRKLKDAGQAGSSRDRRFLTTAPVPFDTYNMVCKLEAEGFTRAQAQALTRVLVDMLRSSTKMEAQGLVSKFEMDSRILGVETKLEKIASELRNELARHGQSGKDFSSRLQNEMEKIESRTREEFQKTKANHRLDMNLATSRAKEDLRHSQDAVAENLKRLESMLYEHQKEMEKMKLDIVKGVMGFAVSVGGLGVGIWRLALAIGPSRKESIDQAQTPPPLPSYHAMPPQGTVFRE
eukprot:SAG31_NODE_640_length_13322_cov_4.396703_13_plen_273_part_00